MCARTIATSRPVKQRRPGFRTKELSKKTWPDYARFFSQGNGWDHCGCTAYQGFRAPKDVRKWADKRDWNLNVKCDLVERGRAHGILVYDGTAPIGWCQFGPNGELPITDDRRSRKLFEPGEDRVWRITCFCTDPEYSQQGVADVALKAAIEAIRKRGGGLIEAYPMPHVQGDKGTDERQIRFKKWWKEYKRLMRRHGDSLSTAHARALAEEDEELRLHLSNQKPMTGLDQFGGGREVVLDGVGAVNAIYWGRFHGGTVAMFEREGFKAMSVLPPSKRTSAPAPHPSRLLMQKTVRGRQ